MHFTYVNDNVTDGQAPLLMGNDVRHMSSRTLAIYGATEVVAVDQTWGGAIGYRVSSPLSPLGHVWAAPNLDGRWDVVAFNDDGAKLKNVTVLFTDLGMPENQVATVRDLWERKDVGQFTGRFTAKDIPPHGSMMLAVTVDAYCPRIRVQICLKRVSCVACMNR